MHLAVKEAIKFVDLNDMLILVTAEHSHSLAFIDYAKRNVPVNGVFERKMGLIFQIPA